ncbi:MAG: carboxypeptidase-like regulatory domain-containing protein [Gemmataceae bacterium]
MSHRARTGLGAAVVLLAALGSGCGGSNRFGVSGTVTLNGQPLTNATIQFFRVGETAPAGGAVVTDGKYELPAHPGLPPGSYTVSISSPTGTGGGSLTANPGAGSTPATGYKDRVPAKYNTDTELRAEVTANGPNKFDFNLS